MQNEKTKIRKIRAISRFSSVSNTGSGLREAHTAGVEIWRLSNKLVATMDMLKNRREMLTVWGKKNSADSSRRQLKQNLDFQESDINVFREHAIKEIHE